MSTVMDPLRDEHTTLLPHIERLRTTADAVGEAAPGDLRTLVDESFAFPVHHLIPHAGAEDKALYPRVQQVMGGQNREGPRVHLLSARSAASPELLSGKGALSL